MANVQITQLPNANPLTGVEQVPIVQSGITVKTTTGAIAAAYGPLLTAEFVLINYDPTLPNSRYISSSLPIRVTDNGAGSSVVISIDPSGVTPGSYTNANITVNSKGLITAASNGADNVGVTLINTGLGLTGGPITSTGTISIDPTVTATLTGTQTLTNKTMSGSNNTFSNIPNTAITGLGTMSTQNANSVNISGGNLTGVNIALSSIESTPIGALTPSSGVFTSLVSNGSPVITGNSTTTLTNKTISGSSNTLTNIANASLVNSDITVNGVTIPLGSSGIITASLANALNTGTGLTGGPYDGSIPTTFSIDSTVATLTGTQTLTNKTISGTDNTLSNIGNASLTNSSVTIGSSSLSLGGTLSTLAGVSISGSANTLSNIGNASLTNSSVTYNGTTVSLGGSGTITAANPNALTIGTGLTGTSYDGSSAVTVAIDSTVVTLTGTQILTNKTLTTPIVNTSLTLNGMGVTSYTPFANTMASFVADDNNYKLIYIQNKNNGSTASADYVAYNDASDVDSYFIDMGIVSSNYTDAVNTVFPPNSGYVYTGGGSSGQASALLLGTSNAASDIIMFTGDTLTANTRITIKGNTGNTLIGAGADTGELFQVNGSVYIDGASEFGSTVLLSANPTLNLQAATKQYVDQAVSSGFTVHAPAVYSSVAPLPAYTYYNGPANDGIGATITATSNAALVLDGHTFTSPSDVNIRVLIRSEPSAGGFDAYNGIYNVNQTGSGSTPFILERVTDFNHAATGNIANNAYVFIESGATLAGDSYVLSVIGTIVVGTTPLTFTQFANSLTYTGGTNIDVSGTVISLTGTVAATNGGTGTSTVTTGDLLYGSATNTWSKLPLGSAYKALIINASGTQVEWNAIPLNQTTAVSGQLNVSNGGTGVSTLSGVVYGNGTSPFTAATGSEIATAIGSTAVTNATNATNATTSTNLAGGANGSVPYQTGSGATTFLAAGANGYVLTLAGGVPTWAASTGGVTSFQTSLSGLTPSTSTTGAITLAGTLGETSGGTNQTTYTTGDILYASATNTLSKLPIGTTGQVLSVAGGIPSWSSAASGGVSSFSAGTTGFTPNTATTGVVTLAGTLATSNGGTGLTSFTTNGAVYATSTSALTTGTLPVASGGTGAVTLTGVLYGNGSSAFTVATGTQITTAIGANAVTNATNAANTAITTGSATTNYLAFVTATTGNLPVLTNTGLTYDGSTNAITGGISGGTF